MQIQGTFPNYQLIKKMKRWKTFGVGFTQIHRQGIQGVIKLCKPKQRWMIQVGTKMVHVWTTNNNFHKINHGQDLERRHHLLCYSYSLTNDKGYIKMTKSLRGRSLENTQFLSSYESHNFITL